MNFTKSLWNKICKLFKGEKRSVLPFEDDWLQTAEIEEISGGLKMEKIRFLVIHYTAGASALSSISYWRRISNGICAQFVIERDGTIYQTRKASLSAYHAGASRWHDPIAQRMIYNLNSCSIGIELANGGYVHPDQFSELSPLQARHKHGGPVRHWERYPQAQVEACKALCYTLAKEYGIHDVVGHEDIAPDRKTDPGPAFPMKQLREYCGLKGEPESLNL